MPISYPMTDVSVLADMAQRGWYNRHWYNQANEQVQRMAVQFGQQQKVVADVLAITSPRVSVTRNIRATRYYFQSGHLPTDLIHTTHLALAHYNETGEIRGPKTSRFAKCLMLEQEPVVLDVWMAVALLGDRKLQKWFGTKGGYAKGEQRIRETAEVVGLTPAQTQAAIWATAYASEYKSGRVPQFGE